MSPSEPIRGRGLGSDLVSKLLAVYDGALFATTSSGVMKKVLRKASGKDLHRPELAQLIGNVRERDTVICHAMDRLARNLDDLRQLLLGFTDRGVHVRFEKEKLTFRGEDSPMSHLLLSVMEAFAQFQRDLIRERQRESIASAKLREGAYVGRKHCLSPAQTPWRKLVPDRNSKDGRAEPCPAHPPFDFQELGLLNRADRVSSRVIDDGHGLWTRC